MYLLTWILAFVIVAIVVFIAVFFGWVAIQTRARRRSEPGFEYIYVADDGSARELDVDEQEYLRTKFQPADGARPYIKFKYESLTLDGKLRGYLKRRQLPKDIPIQKSSEPKS